MKYPNREYDKLTIEHVMPQTLTEQWRIDLGPSADEVYKRYLHVIGNLTLTGYNPELSNEPFSQKRELLSNSILPMNKEIAKHTHWGEYEINERGAQLAERAVRIWPGPVPVALPPSNSPSIVVNPPSGVDSNDNLLEQVLKRLPIPKGQMDLYQILAQAGEKGVSWTDLSEKMKRSHVLLSGVLGALGHRINRTPGVMDNPGISALLNIRTERDELYYSLKPELVRALKRLGILPSE